MAFCSQTRETTHPLPLYLHRYRLALEYVQSLRIQWQGGRTNITVLSRTEVAETSYSALLLLYATQLCVLDRGSR